MTRFNPDRKHRTPQEWTQEAYKITSQNNLQFHVIGGLCLGVLVAGATTLTTGALIAGYTLWTAWIRSGNIQRNQSAIIDTGCIAQVLEGDNFQDYLGQVGHDTVMSELKYAQQRGLAISNDALDYLENSGQPLLQLIDSGSSQRTINVITQPQLTQTVVETHSSDNQQSIDVVMQMTERIQNLFGVGQGGSGKGMLLANACRAVKSKHPGKIFLINGKDDPKEHDYFVGVVDVEKRLHCETAKPQTVAAWFEAATKEYDDFAAKNNGALLVIDEATIIGARLKDAKSNALNDKIIGITSCGGSMGKNIWVFAQTPFASGSGGNLTALSQMISIVLVRGDSIGVLEQWKRSALFRKFDASEVADLANSSECNRAVYWGGSASWYSMPRLTNYSSVDRDTGTFIKDVLTPVEQLEKLLNINEQPTTIQDDVSNNVDLQLLDCIIDKIALSEGYISFEGIRSHIRRVAPDLAKTDLIETALSNLIKAELIEGNRELGYRSN